MARIACNPGGDSRKRNAADSERPTRVESVRSYLLFDYVDDSFANVPAEEKRVDQSGGLA